MDDMITYNNDNVQTIETPTNFKSLGVVNVSRLNGSIPFYSFYNGRDSKYIMREDQEICIDWICIDFLKDIVNL